MKRIATYDNRYKQAVETRRMILIVLLALLWFVTRLAGRSFAAAAGHHCIKNGRAAQGAQPVL